MKEEDFVWTHDSPKGGGSRVWDLAIFLTIIWPFVLGALVR